MSIDTSISFCDSTATPNDTANEREFFDKTGPEILNEIDERLSDVVERPGLSNAIFRIALGRRWEYLLDESPSDCADVAELTAIDLFSVREAAQQRYAVWYGQEAARIAIDTIESAVSGADSMLRLNRDFRVLLPQHQSTNGASRVPGSSLYGHILEASRWPDLMGQERAKKPWLNSLPRVIYMADIGAAIAESSQDERFSNEAQCFLEEELKQVKCPHLWIWLAKSAENLSKLADRTVPLRARRCLMMIAPATVDQQCIDALRAVDAPTRGLMIQSRPSPLIIQRRLNLDGVHWVVVQGHKLTYEASKLPSNEELIELREQCERSGVAFFCESAGELPVNDETFASLLIEDGWYGTPKELRVRQIPEQFERFKPKHE